MRITISDLREAGVCASGLREFFKKHGLSLRQLIDEGIEAQALEDTGDALAIETVRVIREKKAQEVENGGQ